MNRGIYAVAGGLITSQRWLDVTANNLANVATTGFKGDTLMFNDALQRELRSSNQNIGRLGSGAQVLGEVTDMAQGKVEETGNPLDVALHGEGMLAVQTSAGVRYTRSGSLGLGPQGTLITRAGNEVLDDTGAPITIPEGSLAIDKEGSLSVNGQAPFAKLGIYQGTFKKEGGELFDVEGNATLVTGNADTNPTVQQGAVETSNVNPMLAMVDLIKLGRSVELSQKAIQSQDDMTGRLIQSLEAKG